MQSTLFVDYNQALDEIWAQWKGATKEQFKLDSCNTKANRYFDITCIACGRHVKGHYGSWDDTDGSGKTKMHAMDDLCRFFGVMDCSTRRKSGCHVRRKAVMDDDDM